MPRRSPSRSNFCGTPGVARIRTVLFTISALSLLACGAQDTARDNQPAAAGQDSTSARQSGRVPGRWNKPRELDDAATLTAEQRQQIEELKSVGYVDGSTPAPDLEGVVLNDTERSAPGFNFYTSGHGPEAILADMDGRVLHRWRYDFHAAFPEHTGGEDKLNMEFWRRAYLYPDGGLLAVFDGLGLIRLDKDSKLLWASGEPAHHDLEVLPNGDIYVLTREAHLVKRVDPEQPILEDFIVVIGQDGSVKKRLSLLQSFENSDEHDWKIPSLRFWEKEKIRHLAANPGDIFHTNALAVLDGRLADRDPAFAAGNVMLSLCHLDMIAIVDMGQERVVWSLLGESTLQHDPSITPRGGLLFFDNHYRPLTASAATELDPITREPIWRYAGTERGDFFSRTCGTAQRLANGNTLITESDNGRAFELTEEKEIVWEFYNPHRAGNERQYIATLFELLRLPAEFPVGWAAGE